MINNLEITADLPSNVEFTGRSSVAIGESIYYNPATHSITWSLDELEPTFGPYGKIIGISFEVAITPSEDQLNQSPPLLSNIQATSSDSFTKATLYASGQNISTDIPTDTKAADKGVVEDY